MSDTCNHHLITICFSHYNEKARWALDRFGVAYRESGYLPLLHMPFALWASRLSNGFDSVSSPASTPILVTPTGVVCDSSDIVSYVSGKFATNTTTLYPNDEARTLDRSFSTRLGKETRRLAYGYTLRDKALTLRLAELNVGGWQAAIYRSFFPIVVRTLHNAMTITPQTTTRAMDRIRQTYDEVEAQLSDGRPYLTGDCFTAADLSFAALSAPALLVEQNEGYFARLPYRSESAEPLRAFADELRSRPAGQHALAMFRSERTRRVRS